jgi:hypothetical protein
MTYYGSTCEPRLARRLSKHKASYKQYKAGKRSYTTSFKIIETRVYEIILIEEFACTSKDQLHARERYYIENNDCINKYIPGRTKQEYRETHREQHKEYREAHREQQKEYDKVHREQKKEYRKIKLDCSCGGKYTNGTKSEHMRTKKHKRQMMLLSFQKFSFCVANIFNIINNIPVQSRS